MNLFWNATVKTLVVGLAGAIGPAVLTAFDHPTGGMAAALATNPSYALTYGAVGYFAHNLFDHYFGVAQKPA